MSYVPFSQGNYGIVSYSVEQDEKDDTTYLVQCDKELLNCATSDFFDFIISKVPKFGKYEVEEFVAKMLLVALAQGDITSLMNTTISFDDAPYNNGYYSKNKIREKIFEFSEIIRNENGIITLKYLGKPNI